jgi:hypothetical protein
VVQRRPRSGDLARAEKGRRFRHADHHDAGAREVRDLLGGAQGSPRFLAAVERHADNSHQSAPAGRYHEQGAGRVAQQLVRHAAGERTPHRPAMCAADRD